MSEIKITLNSLENAILKDGLLVSGYITGNGYIDASGNGAHAEGFVNSGHIDASGHGAHAEGYAYQGYINAFGNGAHAEGINTLALANGAHAEGIGSKNIIKNDSTNVLFRWVKNTDTPEIERTIDIVNDIALDKSVLDVGNIIYYEDRDEYRIIIWRDPNGKAFTVNKAFGAISPQEGTLLYKISGVAYGLYSHAEGYNSNAFGEASHAEGLETIASGAYSHASGKETIANQDAMTAIGKYNELGNSGDLFIVGNGNSIDNRSNAFRVAIGGVYFAGAHTSGADYAEFFEWSDGNPKNEDRIGHFVSINTKGKIKIADSSKDIVGIISGTPSVVGNSASEDWHKKYITDVFGRIQYNINSSTGEKIQQINPEYDSNKEYISREYRKEWASVGLLGQLVVIDDGTCKVGKKCDSNEHGIATTGNSYIVLERLDDTHIKILFK